MNQETNQVENVTEPVRHGIDDRRASGAGNRRNRRSDNKGVIIQPDSLAGSDVAKSVYPDVVVIGDAVQSETNTTTNQKENEMNTDAQTQSVQQSEGEQTMQTTNDTTKPKTAFEAPAKPVTAFQAMMEARLQFEQQKTKAILQVRQLVEDWAIDIKKDVFPESIKPRKPYAKRKPKVEVAAPTGVQTNEVKATLHAAESKPVEADPALVWESQYLPDRSGGWAPRFINF